MHRAETSLIVLLLLSGPADAADRVEKGFFREQGVDPELTFFQAAAPIATALAAGQIDVGATGLTAALYNIVLGGERLWLVADKGREWPGYPLTAIVVQKDLCDLKGRRIGVTQLGNALEKDGLTRERALAFMKGPIALREIVDTSFVEAPIKELDGPRR